MASSRSTGLLRVASRALQAFVKPGATAGTASRLKDVHCPASLSTPPGPTAPFSMAGAVWHRPMSVLFPEHFVTLNTLSDNPGATKKGKRVGRGPGSGLGKTCGRGHKGQKARTGRGVKLGFEGGQTPLRRSLPKRGFHNRHNIEYWPVNLDRIQNWIDQGRLDAGRCITMKDLQEAGVISNKVPEHGVKLLGRGAPKFSHKIDIQVSQVSPAAREAVEAKGGSVTTVYYNKLGLRALLKPEWFPRKGRLLPRPVRRPPPKLEDRFQCVGSIPAVPEQCMRPE